MADENNDAKVAAGFSVAAAIGAALAWLNTRKVAAGEAVIPAEVIQLLVAIAASSDSIDGNVQEILLALGVGGGGGGGGITQGWPPNCDSVTGLRVSIFPATGVQLPSILIPSGMALVIKAWVLNPAWLFVGPSIGEVSNMNQSFPLLPSETVSYFVENADQIYISAMTPLGVPTAGCYACLTVEQRRRGG
jgi:hypothetical protein